MPVFRVLNATDLGSTGVSREHHVWSGWLSGEPGASLTIIWIPLCALLRVAVVLENQVSAKVEKCQKCAINALKGKCLKGG